MPDPFEMLREAGGRTEPSAVYRQRLAAEVRSAFDDAQDLGAVASPGPGPKPSEANGHDPFIVEVDMDMKATVRDSRRRFALAVAAGVAAVVAAGAIALVVRDGSDAKIDAVDPPQSVTTVPAPTTTADPPTNSPSTAAAAALPEVTELGDVPQITPGDYTTDLEGTHMAASDSVLYVTNVEGGLARYDLETGALLGSTPFPEISVTRIEYAFGSVWTLRRASNVLHRIDGATGEIQQSITLPFQFAAESRGLTITSTSTDIWVLSDSAASIAARVDPTTNTVAGTIRVPAASESIDAGFDSLWITQFPDSITRIDPADGTVLATIDARAQFLAVNSDGVWALDSEAGVVHRIDPASNTVVADITVADGAVGAVTWSEIEAGDDLIWIQMTGLPLSVIDPATNTVAARYDSFDHGGIALTTDGAWIGETFPKAIRRVPLP